MSAGQLKERLRVDLKVAMRERKQDQVAVLRTLIAAVDNAEAQPSEAFAERLRQRETIGEVARRELAAADLNEVLEAEARSRVAAAEDYVRHGRPDDAARLRREADLIGRYRA